MFGRSLTKVAFRSILVVALTVPLLIVNMPIVRAGTNVGGPIISDTTWTAVNSPYIVVGSVDIWEGVTLTIEPGVTVRFDSDKELEVNGELVARGTSDGLITFTSSQPDPAPGDWNEISFTSTAVTTEMDAGGQYISGSVLQYCVVEYGGEWYGAINAHSLLIDHCTVHHALNSGIYNPGTETSPSRITNNTLTFNETDGDGGGIYTEHATVSNNTVAHNRAEKFYAWKTSHGAGIYAISSTVVGNTVTDNSSTDNGGGIYAEDSSVRGNTVMRNRAYEGAGIYAVNSSVNDNVVSDNRVYLGASDTLYGGGGIHAISGTVVGNTVTQNHSYEDGGGIFVKESEVTHNKVTGNSADSCGGGIYAWLGGTISENTVDTNSAAIGGGIYADAYFGGEYILSANVIVNNSAEGRLGGSGGLRAEQSIVTGNTIVGNSANWGGSGAGIYGVDTIFLYNTVIGNSGPSDSETGGLSVSDTPEVHSNNLYGNDPYDVRIGSSDDVSGTYNYWGTGSSVDILGQVYDWYDDSSRGKFLYIPYLQEPSEDAPLPPPTGLTIEVEEQSVALSWDSHPSFTTGYGYKVYYDIDSSLPPYEGTGLDEGDAPIDVGDQTAYTLSGLDPSKDYYFAATAYDNKGHESWYSNVEWTQGGYWLYLPVVLRE